VTRQHLGQVEGGERERIVTTWFTADTHFGHANIIKYCERPFSSLEEMDETLIENWNNAVKPNDTIYHLGDFSLAGKEAARVYFLRLNGNIFIVPGGHDRKWLKGERYFSRSGHPITMLPPLYTFTVSLPDTKHPQPIVLCHYSMRVWDRAHYGSWHLYGHSHGNLPSLKNSLDVGVDCWAYRLLSLDNVHREMKE